MRRRGDRKRHAALRSRPACRGTASTPWWWRRSASPGFSTVSRSPWSAPRRARSRRARFCTFRRLRHRPHGQRLCGRRGGRRCDFLRLALPIASGAQEAVLRHARGLPASRRPQRHRRWNLGSFLFFRFLTGAGIGGEYTATDPAIQELIPARAIAAAPISTINGSFWIKAALGAVGIDRSCSDPQSRSSRDSGLAAGVPGIGATLGLAILFDAHCGSRKVRAGW